MDGSSCGTCNGGGGRRSHIGGGERFCHQLVERQKDLRIDVLTPLE